MWVIEHLTAENIKKGKGVERSKSKFREDDEMVNERGNQDRGHQFRGLRTLGIEVRGHYHHTL